MSRYIPLLVFCTLAISSVGDSFNELDWPIFDDVYDMKYFHQSEAIQLHYKLTHPYPASKVLKFYEAFYERLGWSRCVGGIQDWEAFGDLQAASKPVTININRHWVSNKKKQLSILILRYQSSTLRAYGQPDNDNLEVNLIQSGSVSLENLREHLDALQLVCSDGFNGTGKN